MRHPYLESPRSLALSFGMNSIQLANSYSMLTVFIDYLRRQTVCAGDVGNRENGRNPHPPQSEDTRGVSPSPAVDC